MVRKGNLIARRLFIRFYRKGRANLRIPVGVRATLFLALTFGGYIALRPRNQQTPGDELEELDSLVQDLKKSEKQLRAHLNEEHVGGLRRRVRVRRRPPEERIRAKRLQDPVRTKHLEHIASLLQAILFCLQSQGGTRPDWQQGKEHLRSLLDQLETPMELSRDNAWELSGLFEIALVEVASDPILYSMLTDVSGGDDDKPRLRQVLKRWLRLENPQSTELQSRNGNDHLRHFPYADDWDKHFSRDELKELLGQYKNGTFRRDSTRLEAKWRLTYLYMTRWDEYRHDRAVIQLLGTYARFLTVSLAILLPLLVLFYVFANLPVPYTSGTVENSWLFRLAHQTPDIYPPAEGGPAPVTIEAASNAVREQYVLPFIAFAGAVGSVFGRMIKFIRFRPNPSSSDQISSNEEDQDDTNNNPPLGLSRSLRELLSEVRNMVTQPLIGATAAVILYLALRVGAFAQLNVPTYGIAAFLAGFSEAYFLNTLQRLGDVISPRS